MSTKTTESCASLFHASELTPALDRYNKESLGIPNGHKMRAVEFLWADRDYHGEEVPYFDIAISHLAMHEMMRERKAMELMVNFLKPGGTVYISDYAKLTPQQLKLLAMAHDDHVARHGYSEDHLMWLLIRSGLKDVYVDKSFTFAKKMRRGPAIDISYLLGIGQKLPLPSGIEATSSDLSESPAKDLTPELAAERS